MKETSYKATATGKYGRPVEQGDKSEMNRWERCRKQIDTAGIAHRAIKDTKNNVCQCRQLWGNLKKRFFISRVLNLKDKVSCHL